MNTQNLDLMITGSLNNMQNLPTFLGNALLTATSTIFPVLVLFVSFFILYKVSSVNGGWRGKLTSIAPYLLSLTLITALLSMYTKQERGTTDFMQNLRNYTVVDMISTVTSFGPIFANYLTHATLYGSIALNKDNNEFAGWFSTNIEESLKEANKENEQIEENKKLLLKYSDSAKIFQEVNKYNDNLTPVLYKYVNDLYDTGIILNHNDTLGKAEAGGNFTKSYDSDANYFIQLNVNNNQALNKRNYSSTLKDLESTQIDKFQNNRVVRNNYQNNTDDTLTMYIDEIINDSTDANLKDYEINITKAFHKYIANYSSYKERDIRKALSLLHPQNLTKEDEAIKIWKETSAKHFKLFDFYNDQLAKAKEEYKSLNNSSENDKKRKGLEVVIKSLNSNILAIKNTISKVALAYKDTLTYYKNLSENYLQNDFFYKDIFDSRFIENINRVMEDSNYFATIEKNTVITKDDFVKLNNAYLLLKKDTLVPKFSSFSREALENSKDANTIVGALNSRLESKRVVLTYLFNRTKEILQNDLLLQKQLGLEFNTPFARVFMPEADYNTFVALDNTKRSLRAEYLTNYKTAAKKLTNDLTNLDPKLKESPINWYELGANYGTFKLAFSKSLIDSMLLSNIQDVDKETDLLLLKSLQELDPKSNANRVLNGLAAYNTLKTTEEFLNITKKVVVKNVDKAAKTSKESGSLFAPLADMFTGTMAVYGIMYLINVILPAVAFLAAVLMYYIDVSIIVAFLPIIFIFMIFQSYHGTTFSILKTLLGLILVPIGLVVMFFIILYIDIFSAYIVKVMLPFFNTDQGFINSINIAMGGNTGFINTSVAKVLDLASSGTKAITGNGFMQYIGPAIHTIISFIISVILLTYFFKVNDYISKLFNVSIVGSNVFNENSMKSLTNKTPFKK
jgi:hypothetical protein